MTLGLRRVQIGVTPQMVETFGEYIWQHSHNIQVRRGDAVRALDWAEIEAQRPGTGMSDAQIAGRIGLTREQVIYIRLVLERRKFNRRHFHRQSDLGGGRRFRAERFTPHEERFAFSGDAIALREALDFDPRAAERYIHGGQWNADTVTGWLEKWAAETPDRTAIQGPSGALSYAETRDKARRLAGALLDLGLAKGDVVAIQLPNVPEFLLAYFAVTMIGGVLGTLHMPYRQGEMAPLLRHARARAVICGGASETYDAPAEMVRLKDVVETLEHVIVAGGTAPEGTHSLADFIDNGTARGIEVPAVASDPAILCFTSGTSAAPKAVIHTYHTMLSNNRECAALYGIGPNDVFLSGPPFTHAFGICIINFALLAGGTNLLMPLFTPPALAETIERGRPTVLFVAPAHIAACLEAGAFDGIDLSPVRSVTISGSPCPLELAREFDARLPNGVVGQMWGMTEMFMGLVTPFDDAPERRHGTLGKATPAVENRITGPDGAIVEPGQEGEIEIRGCSVFSGYFGNDQANRLAFTGDGWFRTGDLGIADSDGYVRLTGRVKDIINRGGIKINPADLETLLDGHPAVLQSAIAPMPDPVLGEKACLFVTLTPGASLTLEEACDYLAANDVAKMKWPERLEVIPEMPMTPTRKIIKGDLARRVADPPPAGIRP